MYVTTLYNHFLEINNRFELYSIVKLSKKYLNLDVSVKIASLISYREKFVEYPCYIKFEYDIITGTFDFHSENSKFPLITFKDFSKFITEFIHKNTSKIHQYE